MKLADWFLLNGLKNILNDQLLIKASETVSSADYIQANEKLEYTNGIAVELEGCEKSVPFRKLFEKIVCRKKEVANSLKKYQNNTIAILNLTLCQIKLRKL